MSELRFSWAYSKEDGKAILKTKIEMMEAKLRMLQDLAKEAKERLSKYGKNVKTAFL